MSEWLKILVSDFSVTGIIVKIPIVAVVGFLTKKVADLLISKWWDIFKIRRFRAKGKFLVDFREFYGDELKRHEQPYVQRMELSGAGTTEARGVVQKIVDWATGPTHFLILSGEGAIGKSRCCIEAAKIREMKWINVKAYKNTPDKLLVGLEDLVHAEQVCVYEDYQEYRDAFGKVVDLIIRRKGKLLVISREELGPKGEIENREKPELIQLRKMAEETLKAIAQEKASQSKIELDDLTLQTIIRISEGIPGIVVLAMDQYAKEGTLQGIENYDQLLGSIYRNLEDRFGRGFEKLIGSMALVRGLDGRALGATYRKIKDAMYAGQIVSDQDGNYRIQPDILNDYIAKEVFFEPHLSPNFEPTIKDFLSTRSREILTTLVNCNHRESTRRGVAIFLAKARALDAKTVVTLGISAYEAFQDLELVQSNLGEFWQRVWELADPDDYHRTATVLAQLAKWSDAKKCWNKALELCQAEDNQWGVGTIYTSLGSMSLGRNHWAKAIEYYEKALEVFRHIEGDLGIYYSAQSQSNIASVYAAQGEWEKAVEQLEQALETFQKLKGDYGLYGEAQVYYQKGNILHSVGEIARAIPFYEFSLEAFETLKNANGRASVCTALSLAYAEDDNWDASDRFFQKANNIMQHLGDLTSIAATSRQFGSLFLRKGDWESATDFYASARETSTQLGDTVGTAEALMGFASVYQKSGNLDEAGRCYEEVRKLFAVLDNPNLEAEVEVGLGSLYLLKADWDRASACYESAIVKYQQTKNRYAEAIARLNLGAAVQNKGDNNKRAIELYEAARETFEQLGNQIGMANAYLKIGAIYHNQNQWDKALAFYSQSLIVAEKIANLPLILDAMLSMATVYENRGETDRAIEIYERTLETHKTFKNPYGIAIAASKLASLHELKGEWAQAEQLYQESLAISERLQNPQSVAEARSNLASLYKRQGHWDLAIKIYNDALEEFERLGNAVGKVTAYRGLGWVFYSKGDSAQALHYLNESSVIADTLENKTEAAATYSNLGAVYESTSRYEKALQSYDKALAIYSAIPFPSGLATVYNNKGIVYRKLGEFDKAMEVYEKSLAISRDVGNRPLESSSLMNIGRLYTEQRDWNHALKYLKQSLNIDTDLQDGPGIAGSHREMGFMYLKKQEWDQAEHFLLDALRSFSKLGAVRDQKETMDYLRELIESLKENNEPARASRLEETLRAYE